MGSRTNREKVVLPQGICCKVDIMDVSEGNLLLLISHGGESYYA